MQELRKRPRVLIEYKGFNTISFDDKPLLGDDILKEISYDFQKNFIQFLRKFYAIF